MTSRFPAPKADRSASCDCAPSLGSNLSAEVHDDDKRISGTYSDGQLHCPVPGATGLALVRVTIGAMFVVFFENLRKGGYPPAGYARMINYIKKPRTDSNWLARDLRTEVSL